MASMSRTTSSTDTTTLLQQAAQSIISGSTKSTLDVNSLVSAMVTARTAAQAAALTTRQNADNAELSAIGKIKSALAALQTALAGLSDGTALNQLSVDASGDGVAATVASAKDATEGNFSIAVSGIATGSKISSRAFAAGASPGSGTLTIGSGSSSMQLNVSSSDSLSSIAKAINTAPANPGVTARVITATDGQHLVLASRQTGAAASVTISAGAGLDARLNTASFTQISAGKDATFSIDGNPVTSASNTVMNAITGITLNLTAASVGTTQTISISKDADASVKAINDFVTAYNGYISTAKGLTWDATQPSGKQAGPLLGDAMTTSITTRLGSLIAQGITAGNKTFSLSAIGVNLKHDGTLAVDGGALKTALTGNSPAVSALFNVKTGIGAALNAFVSTYTKSSGSIDQRTQTLNAELGKLSDQATQLTRYQETLTRQYNAQFSALNRLMTIMQNNTQYLNQLFGGGGLSGTLRGR
ncbi:flagellar filament capping protein FliD [Paraburkholderia sabiae]|uniref:Flagellar hook-associated protein 2 n=1 Tax=Paraburkholderia sabiae TaxID=273251 RepID=A0ABU9QLV9_9BURK|nr:flagellar filament capping protein FliD [Paraburkholderia sabiae]WJZ77299.1 flagellar filament capping protein FliD [Paraburkholderia sabiae]CAD6548056.1 B-type flagellar hook-associated protein 2 [Paraburkholderia sabiae]